MTDDLKDRVKAAVNLADWIRGEGFPLTGGPAEFKCRCPFHDEKTPSFNVVNKGGEGWFFYCHGCEASGDIFEWIMRRKGLPFPQALRLAANSVGISIPEGPERLHHPGEPELAARAGLRTSGRGGPNRPQDAGGTFQPEKYRPLVPEGKVWRYLTEKRRLDAGLLVDYAVGETTDGEAYAFKYQWRPAGWPENRAPRFEFLKVVKVDRPEGKKIEWRDPKGGRNILFGMAVARVAAAQAAGGELIICEGELDAISWAQYGFAAVSVPGGAKYTGWLDLCWDWLQPFKQIHISFDEDAAGRLKVVEIVTRLGIARTDIVRLPEKEAAGVNLPISRESSATP